MGMTQDRSFLLTEQRLAESMELDRMSIEEAVDLMHRQDLVAVEAVGRERKAIAAAIRLVVEQFKRGGRLIYVGAGTSGRLGVLDASECPPTFRADPNMVQGIISGGDVAIRNSVEGAEDSSEQGAAAIDAKEVSERDVVMGIAAGGTTPFVRGALQRAKARGAKTIFFCCVARFPGEPQADVTIRPLVGPEVVTGSTRLKAGTATKLVLNAITTIAMVQIGKVYENLMVDLRASNSKLRDRAARIVATVTGLKREQAFDWVDRAGGHVKLAILMCKRNLDADAAAQLLENHPDTASAQVERWLGARADYLKA
jgi:N-acetylmuramic acid 6-phosphate etherase